VGHQEPASQKNIRKACTKRNVGMLRSSVIQDVKIKKL